MLVVLLLKKSMRMDCRLQQQHRTICNMETIFTFPYKSSSSSSPSDRLPRHGSQSDSQSDSHIPFGGRSGEISRNGISEGQSSDETTGGQHDSTVQCTLMQLEQHQTSQCTLPLSTSFPRLLQFLLLPSTTTLSTDG